MSSAHSPPSADAGAALAAVVAGFDPRALDDHDLLDAVADTERLASWAAERQLALLAEFARRPARVERPGEDPAAARADDAALGRCVREYADDEVAARLRVSRQDAAGRLALACSLVQLPATTASLSAGRIDLRRARVMADELRDLDRATARGIEAVLVEVAERLPAARLRPKVRAAAVAADPVHARLREQRARGERRVVLTPVADGMVELWALLAAADGVAVSTAITAAARASHAARAPGDDRTIDQRKADALVAPFVDALCTGVLAGGPVTSNPVTSSSATSGAAATSSATGPPVAGQRLARHRGQPAELHVTVAASTLLGLDDAPATLRGYGTITAQTARELAPDARWRRILTDPRSGAVLDVGTTVYKPPADLLRFVQVRDQFCTFPGCGYPAVACEFDHTVPFPEGSTSAAECAMRCKRHHRFKHSGPVRVEQDPDGTTRWTMPTGHAYEVEPPAVGPVDHEGEQPPSTGDPPGPEPE